MLRGDNQEMRIEQGTLRGMYSGAPWLEGSRSRSASHTPACFDALFGTDVLHQIQDANKQRAWVCQAAPPLVYDAARARAYAEPKCIWRDHLASRWRARAAERALEAPSPPMSHRMMRNLTQQRLNEFDMQSSMPRSVSTLSLVSR